MRTDVQQVRADLEQVWADVRLVRADVERVDSSVERVETSLLTEFHKWASPFELRVRGHSAAIRALELEVESVSDRLAKLERKT